MNAIKAEPLAKPQPKTLQPIPTAHNLTEYLSDPNSILPVLLEEATAIREILNEFASETGLTFSLYFGRVQDVPLYAVSLYPEHSRRLPSKHLTATILATFLRENATLLRDPRHCLGIWYSEESDTTYLDVSATLPDREEALRLGQEYDQIAIFDLGNAILLETEGQGKGRTDLPPIEHRLPVLERASNDGNDANDESSDRS